MDYGHKQREAFYLIKKYSSLTWYQEIFRLWTRFCVGYEEMLRHPPQGYEPDAWDEANFRAFWNCAADMEEGLVALSNGDKARGYALLSTGFNSFLFSRRFEEHDLSDFGYRRCKAHGANEGIFAYAEKARDMVMADCVFRHTDRLRRDYHSLPNRNEQKFAVPIAAILKTPYGVPPGELPPLPTLDPNAPTVMSGEEVPAMGIWVVEPDAAHQGHIYCMAYLAPWALALHTVSEQEYETNTRWERTGDEVYRKDCDKIKNYPVRWRMLWRDERDYSDGKVPPEEADYLVYRGEQVATPPVPVRLRCESGQPCPQDGRWFTPSAGGVYQDFKKGELMPDFQSPWGETIWQLEG